MRAHAQTLTRFNDAYKVSRKLRVVDKYRVVYRSV